MLIEIRIEEQGELLEEVELEEHLAGHHNQQSHAGKGAALPFKPRPASHRPPDVAAYAKGQAQRFAAEGGTVEVYEDSREVPYADVQNVRAVERQLAQGMEIPYVWTGMSTGQRNAYNGVYLTTLAVRGAGTRVVARAPDGSVAGAVSFRTDPNKGYVEVDYLGSMGTLHGTGSALMGVAIRHAADRGMGLGGYAAPSAWRMWQHMGAATFSNTAVGPAGISADAVREIAAGL